MHETGTFLVPDLEATYRMKASCTPAFKKAILVFTLDSDSAPASYSRQE